MVVVGTGWEGMSGEENLGMAMPVGSTDFSVNSASVAALGAKQPLSSISELQAARSATAPLFLIGLNITGLVAAMPIAY